MTYLDLIRNADYKLDNDAITLGEYEQMIEPLNREIQPEPKKSVWIRMSDRDGEYYCCNNCGEELPRYTKVSPSWDVPFPQKYSIDPTDFCPSCGSYNGGDNYEV